MPWSPTCRDWAHCSRLAAEMDINDLRGISTAFLLLSFIGLVGWAYSRKRKKEFDSAANLPFADEDMNKRTMKEVQNRE